MSFEIIDALAIPAMSFLHFGLPKLDISKHPRRTNRPSLSYSRIYRGRIGSWDSFVADVKSVLDKSPPKSNYIAAVLASDPAVREPIAREAFKVGEEKGVETRFKDNAVHEVSKIARESELDVIYGDYKATTETETDPSNMPDFACMSTNTQELRLCGEAKADWRDQLKVCFESWEDAAHASDRVLWAGAISGYMRARGLKYGFLSTYTYTIFVKYLIMADDDKDDYIWVSFPISWDQKFTPNSVSVRDGLWFLTVQANTGANWKITRSSEKFSDKELKTESTYFQGSIAKANRDIPDRLVKTSRDSHGYGSSSSRYIQNLPAISVTEIRNMLHVKDGSKRFPIANKNLRYYRDLQEMVACEDGKPAYLLEMEPGLKDAWKQRVECI